MNSKNICKFISTDIVSNFTVSSFIFEADKEIMRKPSKKKKNCAFLITAGSAVMSFDDLIIEVNTGDFVIAFRDEEVCAQPDDNLEYMYIDFDGIRSEEIFKRFGIDKQRRLFSDLEGIIPLWKESLSNSSKITVDLAAESVLLYTFSRLVTEAEKQQSVTARVIEITKENFTDPNLSLAKIGEELSYNPKYLSHAFKQETGLRYTEYLKNLRLQFAVSLFNNGIDSVKSVALLSGISDPLYFSTVFKKVLGVTPKEYKESRTNNTEEK